MLYRGIIAFCSEIHPKHINILLEKNLELLNVISLVTYVYSNYWVLNG
jgi:hypothetical protein